MPYIIEKTLFENVYYFQRFGLGVFPTFGRKEDAKKYDYRFDAKNDLKRLNGTGYKIVKL